MSGLSGEHDCGALELILILSGLSDDLNAPCHHEACVKPWHAAVWGCSELSPWWGMTAGATNLSSLGSYVFQRDHSGLMRRVDEIIVDQMRRVDEITVDQKALDHTGKPIIMLWTRRH